jgi:hypothetical protein
MEQKLEEKMQYFLGNCIQCHQAILSFVEKLEYFLKPVMLVRLLGGMMAFCVMGFQMAVVRFTQRAPNLRSYSSRLYQRSLNKECSIDFGGELLEESSQIQKSCILL